MLYFRSCPRCRTGTIELDSDIYGAFLNCLNCGYTKNAVSTRAPRAVDAKSEPTMGPPAFAPSTPLPVVAEVERSEDGPTDTDLLEMDELFADEEPPARVAAG